MVLKETIHSYRCNRVHEHLRLDEVITPEYEIYIKTLKKQLLFAVIALFSAFKILDQTGNVSTVFNASDNNVYSMRFR